MIRIIICFIILSSCKSSQKCDAYTDVQYDIHESHTDEQKKYQSVETIR